MTNISRFVSLCVLALSLLVPQVALAASSQSYLEAKQKALMEIIRKPKSPATEKELQTNFDALLDYDALAKDSLGNEWDKRTPEERKEFQELLTTLVQSSYTKNLRSTLDYNIVFEKTQPAKEGELVETVAKHKSDNRKEPIHINYLVHQVDGKWRVYDIITEGSSLVKNYNSQFRSIIKKNGFSDLIERMKKKAKEN